MVWITKGIKGHPFSVLHSFYKQNVGGITESAWCLHFKMGVNMVWTAKGIKGRPFSVLHSFYKQNVGGITESAWRLHFKMGCYCKESSFNLGVLSSLPPLSLVDSLHVTSGSIFSGSLSSLWPAFVGLFACLIFGPCPLFFFFPFFRCVLFIKFGKVSSKRWKCWDKAKMT